MCRRAPARVGRRFWTVSGAEPRPPCRRNRGQPGLVARCPATDSASPGPERPRPSSGPAISAGASSPDPTVRTGGPDPAADRRRSCPVSDLQANDDPSARGRVGQGVGRGTPRHPARFAAPARRSVRRPGELGRTTHPGSPMSRVGTDRSRTSAPAADTAHPVPGPLRAGPARRSPSCRAGSTPSAAGVRVAGRDPTRRAGVAATTGPEGTFVPPLDRMARSVGVPAPHSSVRGSGGPGHDVARSEYGPALRRPSVLSGAGLPDGRAPAERRGLSQRGSGSPVRRGQRRWLRSGLRSPPHRTATGGRRPPPDYPATACPGIRPGGCRADRARRRGCRPGVCRAAGIPTSSGSPRAGWIGHRGSPAGSDE